MTATTGGRTSRVVKSGSAVAGAMAVDGPLSVADGGTGATTAPEARRSLDVPGLGDDNTLTGDNTLGGVTSISDLRTTAITSDGDLLLTTAGLVQIRIGTGFRAGLDATGLTANRGFTFPDTGNAQYLAVRPLSVAYVAKTANYTLSAANDCVVNATSGTWTATLPPASTCTEKMFIVKNSGAGTITLDGDGAETIDGAATQTIAAGASLTVVCTGSAWIIV